MIRALLRQARRLDCYEWIGIGCGVILIAGLTGVLGPTMDAAPNGQANADQGATR